MQVKAAVHYEPGQGAEIVNLLCDLRGLISREVELEDLNKAYDQLLAGEVKQSVIRYR